MIIESYLAAAEAATALLAHQAVAEAWEKPSALAGYTVGGLAGHLAGQVSVVGKVLDGLEPDSAADTRPDAEADTGPDSGPDAEPMPLLDYYLQVRWLDADQDGEVHRGIRGSGDQYAADGPQALASRTAEALGRLRRDLPGLSPQRVVQFPWGPPALSLADLLTNRMVELVVHIDDLAVSVGVPTPEVPTAASDAVIGIMALLAARRHGPVPLLRALTRTERAPATIAAF